MSGKRLKLTSTAPESRQQLPVSRRDCLFNKRHICFFSNKSTIYIQPVTIKVGGRGKHDPLISQITEAWLVVNKRMLWAEVTTFGEKFDGAIIVVTSERISL